MNFKGEHKTRYESRCCGCQYLAYFDSEPLAQHAATLHRDLGKDHICNVFDLVEHVFIPFKSTKQRTDIYGRKW